MTQSGSIEVTHAGNRTGAGASIIIHAAGVRSGIDVGGRGDIIRAGGALLWVEFGVLVWGRVSFYRAEVARWSLWRRC